MVDDMGRLMNPSPIIKEAAAWLRENRVYAWRGVNVAMKDWGPHSNDEQTQLVDCRNWQAHTAEYMLIDLRSELNEKNQGIRISLLLHARHRGTICLFSWFQLVNHVRCAGGGCC